MRLWKWILPLAAAAGVASPVGSATIGPDIGSGFPGVAMTDESAVAVPTAPAPNLWFMVLSVAGLAGLRTQRRHHAPTLGRAQII